MEVHVHQWDSLKLHFFYLSFFRKFFQTKLKLNIIWTLKFIPAHVFTHPLITKHEKRITRLKYSYEKQEKLLVLE
jgi:hypothetical protein